MAKNLNFKKIKFLVIGVLIIILIGFLIFALIKEFHPQKQDNKMVALELAPEDNYHLYFEDNHYLSGGGNYRMENGNLIITVDGQEYIVRPDGTVWKKEADGSLTQVTDSKIINDVLTKALAAALESDEVSSFLDKELSENRIDLASLSDDQIKELAKILGIDYNQLKALVEAARSAASNPENSNNTISNLSDAMKILDVSRLSEDELKRLAAALGIDLDTLLHAIQSALKDGKTLSVNDLTDELITTEQKKIIEEYLKQLGISDLTADDILNLLKNNHMSFEDFMNKALVDGAKAALESIGVSTGEKKQDSILSRENNDPAININSIGSSLNNSNTTSSVDSYLAQIGSSLSSVTNPKTAYETQNNQDAKKSFLVANQTGTNVQMLSSKDLPTMLTAGTVINATLITGINTDLPGQITALVSQTVYDSFTQSKILIPKGSRLIATYDSSITWGQSRILISWNQLIRPDGVIIALNGYQGIDPQGYAGTAASPKNIKNPNNHIISMIGYGALATGIDYLLGEATTLTTNRFLSALINSSTETIGNITEQLLEKVINQQPTITVAPGTSITVLVNDNTSLPEYKESSFYVKK